MHTTPHSKPHTPNTMENSILVSWVSLIRKKYKGNRKINMEVQGKNNFISKNTLANYNIISVCSLSIFIFSQLLLKRHSANPPKKEKKKA